MSSTLAPRLSSTAKRSDDHAGRSRALFTRLLAVVLVMQIVPSLASSDAQILTLNLACIYAISAIGLNVVFGMGGLLSIAQAAIMAVGGYALILLFGPTFSLVPALLVACVAGAAVSMLMGIVAARVKTHYFILVSLALAEIIVLIATNATGLTGGANGTAIKAAPAIAGLNLTVPTDFFRFATVLLVVVWYLADALRASRIGLGMTTMTVDEHLATAAGVPVQRYRILATMIGGAFAGLAGAMLGLLDGYLGPQNFELDTAILILLIVVVAGRARSGSVVLAALILTILSRGLLTLQSVGELAYGVSLILLIIFAPEGLGGISQSVRKTAGRLWSATLTQVTARR